ncbi:THUMP domain-containing protein 1-like [Argopecten irradians]|uniref:THUMP domain-containing protein 1-like n=1 Tax=Argopecten irradians TaxID=31199 RepID=UPI00370F8F37
MSGNAGKKGKKRPKSYYLKCSQQNKRKVNRLESDIRGFLLTCNSHEKDAVREAYSLLNEYATEIYGPEEVPKEEAAPDEGGPDVTSDEDEEEDIAAALQKEVKAIKTTISSSQRRFQSVQTKAHNCLFIKTSLPDPNELAHTIFSDLAKTRVQKTRYALRFLPIAGTCRAYQKDLKDLAEKLLVKEFQTPFGVGLKYSVTFKARNNNSNDIARTSSQTIIGQIIKTLNPLHSVNFDNPDVVVIVEVIGNVCCLAIVRDFFKFRKYNLVEVVRSPPVEAKEQKTDLENKKSTVEKEPTASDCKDNEVTDQSNEVVDSSCKDDDIVDERSESVDKKLTEIDAKEECCEVVDTGFKDNDVVDKKSEVVSNEKDGVISESCDLKEDKSTSDVTDDTSNVRCTDGEVK